MVECRHSGQRGQRSARAEIVLPPPREESGPSIWGSLTQRYVKRHGAGANAKRRQMIVGVIAAAFGVNQIARPPEMTISPQAL
jgi:hypothetical protein